MSVPTDSDRAMRTKLRILHVPDCASVGLLEQRLADVVRDRPDVEVTRQVVDGAEAAVAAGMNGSPTLLVDGHDPFADPGQTPSLSCRYFVGADGRLNRAPSVAALRRVIESAAPRDTDTAGRNSACRGIGPWGTAARVLLGAAMLSTALDGPHVVDGVQLWAWPIALLGFPAVSLALPLWRASRGAPPLRATGPIGHALNAMIFIALYATTWYAPDVAVLSDAAIIFYGASMLLAAGRGYAGCEVLAVSNWILRRNDQVGCAVFWPVDALEARGRLGRTASPAA